MTELPDFERPPVVEIVAAIQFAPIPQFAGGELVAIGRELTEWTVVETPPAIPPMVELPTGQTASPSLSFVFGSQPMRAVLATEDGRWLAQFQQDRIAVHERKQPDRPSFANVKPMLEELVAGVSSGLGVQVLGEHHRGEYAELSYVNTIASADGGWESFKDAHQVLKVFSSHPADPPYDDLEQVAVSFSEVLSEDEDMVGRLRIVGEPGFDGEQRPVLGLQVVSRRLVRDRDPMETLEACHVDIVGSFAAVTTETMHEIWGRFR